MCVQLTSELFFEQNQHHQMKDQLIRSSRNVFTSFKKNITGRDNGKSCPYGWWTGLKWMPSLVRGKRNNGLQREGKMK